MNTSQVIGAVTDVPTAIGDFVGTYGDDQSISPDSPVNLSTMVRFHWSVPDSQLKHRVQKCWATKIADAKWDDTGIVKLVENGCPKFSWVTVGNPGETRFPVFAFLNRNGQYLCKQNITYPLSRNQKI